ncbi:MAG: cupin domain-containing protein [Pseudomonadota bacterium]
MKYALPILLLIGASSALAHEHQGASGQHLIDLDALEYQTSGADDLIAVTVAWGDRQSDGEIYATHARAREDAYIPPHTHPNTLTTVVTSGTVYIGVGETFDADALVGYEAGSYFVTEAGVPHFITAVEGDFSVLDHGVGPGGIDFIEQPEGAPRP